MSITFELLGLKTYPSSNKIGVFQLVPNDWDDYSFKTSFTVTYYGLDGQKIEFGSVKIGYQGQLHGWTMGAMQPRFETLSSQWFSLGQDVEYYENLLKLPQDVRNEFLSAMQDVVANDQQLRIAQSEQVYKDSLTRGIGSSTIHGQYKRVLSGDIELTNFSFIFEQEADERHAPVNLDFKVAGASRPSTNVHVLIGRNGVGKTTLLNNMVRTLLGVISSPQPACRFSQRTDFGFSQPLEAGYFSSVVSVSFSAFDPFLPPMDRPDRSIGLAYFYIGMKTARDGQIPGSPTPPKTDADLVEDFVTSFASCLSQPAKRERWRAAILRLESDSNFAEMDLGQLLLLENQEAIDTSRALARRMSSGHSIVLLTMTQLVDTVEEKTLVLLDEPESHLHPPLLSAFTRALSELLRDRNGVAIIATHSPVVLQEVPRSCVWKMTRIRTHGRSDRPERETFGENVGILTREVFGLEVSKSGFHEMLQQAVNADGTFESIVAEYHDQLGAEARAILLTLIAARDSERSN